MKKINEWRIFSLFPKRCAYCDKRITADELMCYECGESLPRINGDICYLCGRGKKECRCKNKSHYYNGIAAPFYYEGNVKNGIRRFKFRSVKSNGKAYAYEMAETIRKRFPDKKFDFITEVPCGKHSLNRRGFNQCSVLAQNISEISGIPFKSGLISKLYETPTQHEMNYFMRRGNLTGAFDINIPEDVKGKTVLLCDDISTSGETLDECSKMLWLYEAEEIYCITAALTRDKR